MSANPERKRWRRPGRLIVIAIIALILIGFFGLRVASSSGLNRELAEVRRQGLPTNPKELDAWYAQVPDSENAALKFIEAQSHFVEPSKANDPGAIEWRDIPHDAALEASVVAMLEEHLRKNEPALRLAHEAAQLTRSRYPSDLSRAPDVSLSHSMQMRGLAQLLRWEAVLKAERGDGTDAAKSLRTGFALAHTVGEEPLLISELVRMLSRVSLPSMIYAPKKEAVLAARLRCVSMALEIERFRARNEGRLPRIDELVPALIKEAPTDPIDGKPLEYRVGENGKGYRIVAVGATATERSGNTGARVQDVAFTVLK